jgi:hypothetical protein
VATSPHSVAAIRAGPADCPRLVWHANGLKPRLTETFKVSRAPQFVEKLEDIVGLYPMAPERALLLCCNDKSQAQALDCSPPGLPMKKDHAATMIHDDDRRTSLWYTRNGTTHKHLKVESGWRSIRVSTRQFTPTSASWLDMVERFFRSISTDCLERGVFRSVSEWIAAIEECIVLHNRVPKPFVWTAKANDILQKVIRANRRLGSKSNEATH